MKYKKQERTDNIYYKNNDSQLYYPKSMDNLCVSLPEKNFKLKEERNQEKIRKNLSEIYNKKVGLDNLGNSCYM